MSCWTEFGNSGVTVDLEVWSMQVIYHVFGLVIMKKEVAEEVVEGVTLVSPQ